MYPGLSRHCCPECNCQLEPNQEASSGHPVKAPRSVLPPPSTSPPCAPCSLHESTLKTVPTRYTVPSISLARGVQLEQVAERTDPDVSGLWDTARASSLTTNSSELTHEPRWTRNSLTSCSNNSFAITRHVNRRNTSASLRLRQPRMVTEYSNNTADTSDDHTRARVVARALPSAMRANGSNGQSS